MVVKRISRRRKKSSSPRKRSRRKSKQKKKSRVRRRSKNKLEGGTSGRTRRRPGIGVVARVPGNIISALGNVRDKNKTALLKDWEKSVNKEEFARYGTGDDARKKMLAAARTWKQAQTVDKVKKFGRKIRGKTYVLLVKKNVAEGSTCVYKPKDEDKNYEYWVNLIEEVVPPLLLPLRADQLMSDQGMKAAEEDKEDKEERDRLNVIAQTKLLRESRMVD